MPSPFPGIDPYLEAPALWPEVHSRLIVALADAIAPSLLPHYYIAIEQRTYFSTPDDSLLIGIPDLTVLKEGNPNTTPTPQASATATLSRPNHPQTITLPLSEEIQERYLEIRETQTGTVITALEILSPKNKRAGEGRDAYLRKRQQILSSATHLIEIDLLRAGQPMPMSGQLPPTHYRILVSRSAARPTANLYSFNLQDPIPQFAIPLKDQTDGPTVNLKPLLDGIYNRAGYAIRIDYTAMPTPPLSPEDKQWIEAIL